METKVLEKILVILFLLFGMGFYAMRVIYKLVDRKNGKKDPPTPPPGPGPGEGPICIEHTKTLTVFETVLPRIDRALGELYRDRFGADPR